jgi:hypothetical protein
MTNREARWKEQTHTAAAVPPARSFCCAPSESPALLREAFLGDSKPVTMRLMKSFASIGALLPLLFASCDQNQGQVLAMRDEFQQQIATKDKALEELNRKLADADQKNEKLNEQLLRATRDGPAPDKIAEVVAARLETRLAELEKNLRGGGPPPGPNVDGGPRTQPQQPQQRESGPSDPTRKKYKMSFDQ